MKKLKVYSEDRKSSYTVLFDDDVEYVNPLEYYKHLAINSNFLLIRDLTEHKLLEFSEKIRNTVILEKANEKWNSYLEKIRNESLDSEFLNLFNLKKKNDQLRLLKGKTISSLGLAKLLFLAHDRNGFKFSQYTSEKLPTGIGPEKLPIIFEMSENESSKNTIIGKTELKEGELKNVILHRKKIVAKFLDKESEWHCFYITYKALAGKETWNNGQPHYHYISDKFGLSREEVVDGIKKGKVPSTPVHIGIIGRV